jgi:hypothetical protein
MFMASPQALRIGAESATFCARVSAESIFQNEPWIPLTAKNAACSEE